MPSQEMLTGVALGLAIGVVVLVAVVSSLLSRRTEERRRIIEQESATRRRAIQESTLRAEQAEARARAALRAARAELDAAILTPRATPPTPPSPSPPAPTNIAMNFEGAVEEFSRQLHEYLGRQPASLRGSAGEGWSHTTVTTELRTQPRRAADPASPAPAAATPPSPPPTAWERLRGDE